MSDLVPGTRVRFWPGWRDFGEDAIAAVVEAVGPTREDK